MSIKIRKSDVSRQDQEFIYSADRKLIERYVDEADVAKVDDAKRQIAEALGVDVDEHVSVNVEMMFLLSL